MAQAILQGSGIISYDSTDFANAPTANYIEKDFTATDIEQEPIKGSLQFTGSANVSDVASGKSFYNTDLHNTKTGTMGISSDASEAKPEEVEKNKTFYSSVSGIYTKRVGTLAFNGTAQASDVASGKSVHNTDLHSTTNGSIAFTGNAVASQVLSGQTFYNNSIRTKVTGTMANRGSVGKQVLNSGGSYTIPSGFHNGQGSVYENTASVQTAVSTSPATSAKIWSGKTAYVNGSLITGTGTIASISNAYASGGVGYVQVSWSYPANSFYSGMLINAGSSSSLAVPTISSYTGIVAAGTNYYRTSVSSGNSYKRYFKIRPYVYINGAIQYGATYGTYSAWSSCGNYCDCDCDDCDSYCGSDCDSCTDQCGPEQGC